MWAAPPFLCACVHRLCCSVLLASARHITPWAALPTGCTERSSWPQPGGTPPFGPLPPWPGRVHSMHFLLGALSHPHALHKCNPLPLVSSWSLPRPSTRITPAIRRRNEWAPTANLLSHFQQRPPCCPQMHQSDVCHPYPCTRPACCSCAPPPLKTAHLGCPCLSIATAAAPLILPCPVRLLCLQLLT